MRYVIKRRLVDLAEEQERLAKALNEVCNKEETCRLGRGKERLAKALNEVCNREETFRLGRGTGKIG